MNNRQAIFFWLIASVLLIVASSISHPLMPQHETLYTGVAWEMWHNHRFFIPLLNGHTYDQKPPLLFWLTHMGWFLFGVNNWWPRIFPGFFGIATLAVCQLLAKNFWGKRDSWVASLILLSSVYWTICTTEFRFDILVAFFGILSLYGIAKAAQQQITGWLIFGIASGLGILSKGPILFLYTIPPVILAPLWMRGKINWFAWYRNFVFSLCIAILILAIWAIPALSNKAYAKSVLWTQTMNRIDHKYAQHKSWIYYLYNLPILFLPWLLSPQAWRTFFNACKKSTWKQNAQPTHNFTRMLLISLIIGFIGICLIGPKETRYALTMVPIFALLLARLLQTQNIALTRWELKPIAVLSLVFGLSFVTAYFDKSLAQSMEHAWFWALILISAAAFLWQLKIKQYQHAVIVISCTGLLFMLVYFFGITSAVGKRYDMRPMAKHVSQLQQQGATVGFLNSRYQDEFQFYGRLKQPLAQLSDKNLAAFNKQHPGGWIVEVANGKKLSQKHAFSQPFGHNQLLLYPVEVKK
jgi:4-amino-4-deoxy-L-arabinose transferase-like glycosyltransferase